jgi:tRNA-splicing ligase RtcB (3'-phosphate/5'-hydroxy nucleic acid ligase)
MAVMPDVHLASEVCIGTVVATSGILIPHAVGGDIGCGMAALAFNRSASLLKHRKAAEELLVNLQARVPIMRQSRDRVRELTNALKTVPLSIPALSKISERDGRWQLGTIGRGNHFLEFQEDDDGGLWLMVHCGSRALGQAIAVHHLSCALTTPTGVSYLDADSPEGHAYLNDVQWARAYAEWNRRCILESVEALMQELFGMEAIPDTMITCDHNHVRLETHFGQAVWVHRKGAIEASEGKPGIIPGSMGSYSYHVAGRGEPQSLCSSSHGAGRAMDRSKARHAVNVHEFHKQLKGIWFDPRLAVRLRDEAPSAYKNIQEVMGAQRDLTRIVRRLRPVLCHKGA